jgi:nucleoside-diphosphate kinase
VERTLVLVKPDGVERGLVGRVLSRLEEKGLRIVGLKMLEMDRSWAEAHYAAHRGKHFYEALIRFVTSGPVAAAAVEGIDAVAVVRALLGATDCKKAAAGTIRGDFGMSARFNLVHASDSVETAREEIARFFAEKELLRQGMAPRAWVYDTTGGEPV